MKRYICYRSLYLLLTATVSPFTRLNGYFKVLFNAKCESVGGDLQHECGTISLIWVEILGIGFPDRWTQGLACGLGDGFQPSLLLWEAPSGCSEPCQPRLICLEACNCLSCGNLACISLGSLFPQTGTIFCIQLSSLDVYRSVPNARLCPAIQGPRHKQVMVLHSRSWAGVGKMGIPASWDGACSGAWWA